MAIVRPFRGVRYDQVRAGNLDDVVSPPYDVITPDEQLAYRGKHPNNIVRLILPKEEKIGGRCVDKYESAAIHLNEWLSTGVLIYDDENSIYICEQEYEINGEWKKRLGFTCLVRLEDYESKTVLPHENILAKPMDDRLNLMRSTNMNFDSVFGLYPSGHPEEIFKPFMMNPPDSVAVDSAGVICNLWRVSNPTAIDLIVSEMANQQILIADGHHRYAAALAYRNEMREKLGMVRADAPHEFVMMTLVSLEDSGLVVLPTHRLVSNIEDFYATSFLSKLAEYFDVKESQRDQLAKAIETSEPGRHLFGLHMGKKSYVIELKSTVSPEKVIESPGSDALKRLDVSILHSLILDKLLGIGTQSLSAQSNLSYKRDAADALDAVDKGDCLMAFLMNPTRVEEVKEVAAAGDKMPQKSTFFYPKLLTGLIMRVI